MTTPGTQDAHARRIALPPPMETGAGTGRAAAATRTGAAESLPLERISALLWAGTQFRHPVVHGRAALPQRLRPLVAVYTVLPTGVYRYDTVDHSLLLVRPGDLRQRIERRGVMPAALYLAYVDGCTPDEGGEWEECGTVACADAAHIAQNIAGYCASQGLVARVSRDAAGPLATALALSAPMRIALVQRVGYPSAGPH